MVLRDLYTYLLIAIKIAYYLGTIKLGWSCAIAYHYILPYYYRCASFVDKTPPCKPPNN